MDMVSVTEKIKIWSKRVMINYKPWYHFIVIMSVYECFECCEIIVFEIFKEIHWLELDRSDCW